MIKSIHKDFLTKKVFFVIFLGFGYRQNRLLRLSKEIDFKIVFFLRWLDWKKKTDFCSNNCISLRIELK